MDGRYADRAEAGRALAARDTLFDARAHFRADRRRNALSIDKLRAQFCELAKFGRA